MEKVTFATVSTCILVAVGMIDCLQFVSSCVLRVRPVGLVRVVWEGISQKFVAYPWEFGAPSGYRLSPRASADNTGMIAKNKNNY